MNYKFFCIILLQGLFLLGSDSCNTQPGRLSSEPRSPVNRLRSMAEVNRSRMETSSNQEIVHQGNSLDVLVQLVRTLGARVEQLELNEELNASLYKERFRVMEREIGRQSRRIAFLEEENNNLHELVDLSMNDAISQIRSSLKADLFHILDGIEKQKVFMTLQILRIQEQLTQTSADISPPATPITARGNFNHKK